MKDTATSPILSAQELQRYARHLVLPDFGLEKQAKLKQSSVLVIGAGGLGSPILLYLAAAGIGKIGIVDFDRVDETNLQRQVLFTTEHLGQSKAAIAKERIQALNPYLDIQTFETALTRTNALEILKDFDCIVDGTDNFPTRYLVNDACVLLDKPLVYGSIFRYEGQVAVFNFLNEDGTRGPNYRDLFPTPPPPDLVPNCAEGGVLGVLPGIIGSMQANEAIKVLAGIGEPLAGKLLVFDASTLFSRVIQIPKNPNLKITELIDYEQFCNPANPHHAFSELSIQEFAQWRAEKRDFQLIDVREAHEVARDHMNGYHIPLGEVDVRKDEIAKNKPVVIHCQSGKRSQTAIEKLQQHDTFENLYNLTGGLNAWRRNEK